jgi:hypothetical protein
MSLKIHAETHPALPILNGDDRLCRAEHLPSDKGATGSGRVLPELDSERVSPRSRHDRNRSNSLSRNHRGDSCTLNVVSRIFIRKVLLN